MAKIKAKGGRLHLEWYGEQELVKKLAKLKNDVVPVLSKGMVDSAQFPKKKMIDFVSPSHHYHYGRTLDSWEEYPPEYKNGIISMEIGFSWKKGGQGAIFLNLGGLHYKPFYFIDKAGAETVGIMADTQNRIIQEELKKCGLS